MPSVSEQELEQMAQARALNAQIMRSTKWQWVQLGNDLGSTPAPAFAVNQLFRYRLANTSAYVKKIRLWLEGIQIDNSSTSAAGALTRSGFYALIGNMRISLGNDIYRVPLAAIPLLLQTFSRFGKLPSYRGDQTYTDLSSNLFNAPSSVAASSHSIYSGYIDIPTVLLEKVNDPDGVTPTLSNTGLQVEFTTCTALQGTDALLNPFTSAGTLALDGSNTGTITVWAEMARLVTVTDVGALPPFVVGPAFVYMFTTQPLVAGPEFYPFQGEQAELILAKSIMVINNPGALTGEFDDPRNVLEMDLQYDATTPVYKVAKDTDPMIAATGGPMNWLTDQGQAIGDQPPGMYVWDFIRGTNADYPNAADLALNLEKFSRAGVNLTYGGTINAGALVYFLNVYLRTNFFQAKGG